MRQLKGPPSRFLAAIGFLAFGSLALAGLDVSERREERVDERREERVERPAAQSKLTSFGDRLRVMRSPALQAKNTGTIDLYIYFDFNSAMIREEAVPQLDELGAALTDPRLRGLIFSINGHTSAREGDGFSTKLSERRAVMIKGYLVDNFQLSGANLRTVGYGKTRPQNLTDLDAPENRRVEIVNLGPDAAKDTPNNN
jgi:outer membrane protein OmpA-like peptidoglycan-associated protein